MNLLILLFDNAPINLTTDTTVPVGVIVTVAALVGGGVVWVYTRLDNYVTRQRFNEVTSDIKQDFSDHRTEDRNSFSNLNEKVDKMSMMMIKRWGDLE